VGVGSLPEAPRAADLASIVDTAGEGPIPQAASATRPRWRRLARPAECSRLEPMEAGTFPTTTPSRRMVGKTTRDAFPVAVGVQLTFGSDGGRDVIVDSEEVRGEQYRICCRHGKRWRAQILRGGG